MVRQHLADEKDFVAPAGDRLANHLLRAAVGVHLGGVDQRHAQVQPQLQGGNLVRTPLLLFTHSPGALAERGNSLARRERHGSKICR